DSPPGRGSRPAGRAGSAWRRCASGWRWCAAACWSRPIRPAARRSRFASHWRFPMRARLLIADDHRMFREGLAAVLPPADFEVVAQVEDGQSAVRMARRLQPDMALLDITMPMLNGVEATREVRRAAPRCKPVIVSMHSDAPYVGEALRAGARGYVVKSQP